MSPADKFSPSANFLSTRKMTKAVPSLNKLSPSISVEILLDTPSSFSRATTATGSVADMIAPKSKQCVIVKLF